MYGVHAECLSFSVGVLVFGVLTTQGPEDRVGAKSVYLSTAYLSYYVQVRANISAPRVKVCHKTSALHMFSAPFYSFCSKYL